MTQPFVWGVDPGLANFGLAVMTPALQLVKLLCIRTRPSHKRLRVLSADDNVRRAQELLRALALESVEFPPALICAEAMSYPRSSASAAKLAMSWGLLVSIGAPLVQASPQAIKQAVCGGKTASKLEVQAAVTSVFPGALDAVAKGKREHMADAVGAVLACQHSPEMIILQRHHEPPDLHGEH